MGRPGRKPEVAHGRSQSAQVRAVPAWKANLSCRDLARALAVYLLWRIEQEDETPKNRESDDGS